MKLHFHRILTYLGVLIVGLHFLGCEEKNPVLDAKITAEAKLFQIVSDTDSTYLITENIRGEVFLSQVDSLVTMTIELEGFPSNTVHAVHMHHGTCEQPKHHWNAGSEEKYCSKTSLGIPWAKPFAGDVGNVSVGYDGKGSLTIKTDLWRIASNDNRDLLGLQIVIHQDYEDFTAECDPNHDHTHAHLNAKIACGTIL